MWTHAGEGEDKRTCALVCYRENLKQGGAVSRKKEGFSGRRRKDGSGRKSPGLSFLSFLGSAVQEKRRLKWKRCF